MNDLIMQRTFTARCLPPNNLFARLRLFCHRRPRILLLLRWFLAQPEVLNTFSLHCESSEIVEEELDDVSQRPS